MAQDVKTFSIINDTLKACVNLDILGAEIRSSPITIALDYIETIGDSLNIIFKAPLPTEDYNILTNIVANHDGTKEIIVPQPIEIVEDRTFTTNGSFQGCMWEWNIPACTPGDEIVLNETYETNGQPIKFPFPTSLLFASWKATAENNGDEGKFVAGLNTVIGELTDNISANSTEFSVSDTVLQYVYPGVLISVNNEQLGRCISIDKSIKKITTEFSTNQTHQIGSYVMMTKEIARRIYFEESAGSRFEFGGNRIGGTLLPANVECNVIYKNKNGAAKTFRLYIEYIL